MKCLMSKICGPTLARPISLVDQRPQYVIAFPRGVTEAHLTRMWIPFVTTHESRRVWHLLITRNR